MNVSNETKIGFVTTSGTVSVGNASTVTTNHRTRITLTAQDGTNGYVYTRPRKLLLNVSTAGHGLTVKIERKTGANGASWTTVGEYTLSGWSGWNDIPLSFATLGGGKNQTTNNWYMRLTFATTSVSSNYATTKTSIIGMRLFGDTCWTQTSNMGETGHLYSYDTAQNATFPAKVTASGGFSGNGASLTNLNASNISSGTIAAARLPKATTNALGVVMLGYSASGKNYAIQADSNNKLYVNIPWTDTKVTQTITSSNATYPLLLAPSGQTATTTTTSYFDSGVTLNPSTNTIAANISGNAGSAEKWISARTITLKGDATGSVSLDGSKNVDLTVTIANDSHTHDTQYLKLSGGILTGDLNLLTGNNDRFLTWKYATATHGADWRIGVLGTGSGDANYFVIQTNHTGSGEEEKPWTTAVQIGMNTPNVTFAGIVTMPSIKLNTARTFITNLASTTAGSFDGSANVSLGVTGVLPLSHGGTDNDLRNATKGSIIYMAADGSGMWYSAVGTSGQLLTSGGSGKPTWTTATNSNTASTVVKRDGSGNFSAGTITAALSGNASTASKWATARNLTIGAKAKSVDGSANVSWSWNEIGVQRSKALAFSNTSHKTFVIPLCELTNSNVSADFFFHGSIYVKRNNILSDWLTRLDIECGKQYNTTDPIYHITVHGGSGIKWTPVTFTYNSIKYFGVKCVVTGAGYEGSTNCYAAGYATNWDIIEYTPIYNNNTSEIINAEIYNSLVELSGTANVTPMTVFHDIRPRETEVFNLGASAHKWNAVYAKTLYGSGANITNLNASNISSGTIAAARLPKATTSALGAVMLGYSASGKNYAIQADSNGKLYVNVPWTDNNTTYTFTNKAVTLAWNTTSTIATIGGVDITVKLPANPNTDTKNTTGSTNTSNKIFLVGATSQATNPQTYSHDTVYVGTDGHLYSNSQKVLNATNYSDYAIPKHRIINSGTTCTENSIPEFNIMAYKDAGIPVHKDMEFASGKNSITVYDNSSSGSVTITRKTDDQKSANNSGYILQFTHTGGASPNHGGFYQTITSRANAIFIQIFRAKLPADCEFALASNSMGTDYKDVWVTSPKGTGRWEWYGRMVLCGSSGTFSSGGHVSVSRSTAPTASAPITWYMSYCTCFDLTKPMGLQYQGITNITRNGTTFTATRADGTTFTFTQQDNNTHYTTRLYTGTSGAIANAVATNPYLTVTDNNTYRNQVRFVGAGLTTINSDASGNITINSSINKTNVTTALGYTPDTPAQVDAKIAALVDSAPSTLNTLNELAAALGDDPNFATTIAASIGSKISSVTASGTAPLTLSASTNSTTKAVTISGSVANASTSASGVVTTGAQTFAGNKMFTGDILLHMADADRSIVFSYANNTTMSPSGSWRLAGLGSGSSDTNYFVIQSGTSSLAGTEVWNNVIRLGQNTFDAAFGGNLYPLTTNTKTLGTSSYKWSDIYSTKVNGYTLAAACAKGVTDSSSASAIGTGTSVPTERDIYYGLPTINGVHNYTSSTTLFAPTSAGTSGYILKSNGSGAPTWLQTLPVANGGTGNTAMTTNRLVWSESASKLTAGYHYASSTKVAINSTSAPTETFYVNGAAKINGALTATSLNLTSFAKTLTLSANTWTDTGISGSNLTTGTYIIQIERGGEYFSGVMSWTTGKDTAPNATECYDEIVLHNAGSIAGSTSHIMARTVRTTSGIKLQICGNMAMSSLTVNIKCAKII